MILRYASRIPYLAAMAIALSGCSSLNVSSLNPLNWFAEDKRPKMAALPDYKESATLAVIWQSSIGNGGAAAFSPALADGNVFVAAADGSVARLDQQGGAQRWRTKLKERLSGGVGANSALVVVGTPEGVVIALEADTGAERWKARVSSEVLSSPVISGDQVFVRSADSRIFSFDIRDGKRRWVYQRSMPALSVRTTAGVVVQSPFLYAGFPGGKLVSIATSNGGSRWEATVSLPKGATELERVTDVVGLPWVGEREICSVAYQGRVACFDLSNGTQLWSRDLSSISGLGVDARYVYVSDDRGAVHALDRTSGTSVWKQDRLFLRQLTAPIPMGALILAGDVQGVVHAFSRENGGIVGRFTTDGSPIVSAPILGRAGPVIQTRNGTVYLLSVR